MMSDDKTMDKKWPRLFTCPTTREVLKGNVLGGDLYNPVTSTLEEIQTSCDGCPDCDMKDECAAPVEYVPALRVAELEAALRATIRHTGHGYGTEADRTAAVVLGIRGELEGLPVEQLSDAPKGGAQ